MHQREVQQVSTATKYARKCKNICFRNAKTGFRNTAVTSAGGPLVNQGSEEWCSGGVLSPSDVVLQVIDSFFLLRHNPFH